MVGKSWRVQKPRVVAFVGLLGTSKMGRMLLVVKTDYPRHEGLVWIESNGTLEDVAAEAVKLFMLPGDISDYSAACVGYGCDVVKVCPTDPLIDQKVQDGWVILFKAPVSKRPKPPPRRIRRHIEAEVKGALSCVCVFLFFFSTSYQQVLIHV